MATDALAMLRVCQEEKDILNQKLDVHIDRWALEKNIMEEKLVKTEREHRLKDGELNFEIVLRDLRLGSHKQQLMLLRHKLDSALEDTEFREMQISALKLQLQEERKWRTTTKQAMKEMRAKVTSETREIVSKSKRELYRIQRVLDETRKNHKKEVEKVKEQTASAFSQLQEIHLLVSSIEILNGHQNPSSSAGGIKAKLQVLLNERDNLRTEQKQWKLDQEELKNLCLERDQLRKEQKNWKVHLDEIGKIKLERDKLLADKDDCILHNPEMQALLEERDRLSMEREKWLLQEKEMQQVAKERELFRSQLELATTQREGEVKALLRERNFVWSQLKSIGDDNAERIRKLGEKAIRDRQEIKKLRRELKDAQLTNNERMVEMTILKLDAKRTEEVAVETQCDLEAQLKETRSRLDKINEKNKKLLESSGMRDSECTSQTEVLDKRMDSSGGGHDLDANARSIKGRLEALDSGFAQKQSLKSQEQLQRENESLLLETKNLKTLYAELEALYKLKQKPVKVARTTSRRCPITRDLNLELDAAAASCPSEKMISVSYGQLRKRKRVSNNGQIEHRGESEELRSSPRRTRSSMKSLPEDSCPPTDKMVKLPPPKTSSTRRQQGIRLRGRTSSAASTPVRQDAEAYHELAGRTVPDADPKVAKNRRPPLHSISQNKTRGAQPAASTSAKKGVLFHSENQSTPRFATATDKMADLFPSAFGVPRLKTPQLPVFSKT